MIIFYDWGKQGQSGQQDGRADHTGIVWKVENGYVYTIEGNLSDKCTTSRRPIGEYQILGYGVPAQQKHAPASGSVMGLMPEIFS